MSGHLHPLLGIGRRLAEDADVRVISTAAAMPEIAAAGLVGHEMLLNTSAQLDAVTRATRRLGSNPLRLHARLRASLALLARVQTDLRALWQTAPPDLVIADFLVPVVGRVAAEYRVPWWTSMPSPCAIETPDGPPSYLGGWTPRTDRRGDLRDRLGRASVRAFKRAVHRLNRRALESLGVPSVYRADGTEAAYSPERILALGLPELEFSQRFPPAVQWVGPVLYTPDTHIAEPPWLEGRPHVLVTLGTHLSWRRDAMRAAVRHAAHALPMFQFHVSDGDRASDRGERHGNLHRLGYVSYARDLRHYAVVVHHGGAGAVFHTLAAGLPAVVWPQDHDQCDFAARLDVAGAGVWVRDVAMLAQAIRRAHDDQPMRERCRAWQQRIMQQRAEDRVAALVRSLFA